MNTEMQYNHLLEKAYKDYSDAYEKDNSLGLTLLVARTDGKTSYRKPSIEMFEAMIESDQSFSDQRGVVIETRQMTWDESTQWVMQNTNVEWENLYIVEEVYKKSTPNEIKSISYKDKTASKYEYGR